MTEREMVLQETARILSRLPRPLKKSRALRAGRTVLEAAIEGDLRCLAECSGEPLRRPALPADVERTIREAEAHVLNEQVGSGASADGGMIPPTQYGWTESPSTPGTFTHSKAPGHKLMVDGQDWRHHGADGRIIRRGSGQQSLTEYAKTIPGDWGGSPAASESVDEVVARIRRGGAPVVPEGLHTRLAEALVRTAGRTSPGSGDLHERLRRAVTR